MLDHRDKHINAIGKSGMGKSSFLLHIAASDIQEGKALLAIDPHGTLALDILGVIPPRRYKDTIYIDLSDIHYQVGFNPLLDNEINPTKAATDFTTAITDIFELEKSPRLKWFLYNALVVLNEKGDRTLADVAPMFYNERHRTKLTKIIRDPGARQFWLEEYEGYDEKYKRDSYGAIANKLGLFNSSPTLRAIFSQLHPKFKLAQALNNNQIVIVNLAKGTVGNEHAMLMGSLMISQAASILFARTTSERKNKLPIIADEWQNYASRIFAELFSEGRKYGLELVTANQFLTQIPEQVQAAVLGNTGTFMVFRVGAEDAPLLANHLGLTPTEETGEMGLGFRTAPAQEQLTTLPPFEAFLKTPAAPSTTIKLPPPLQPGDPSTVIEQSRHRWARQL